VSVTWTSRSSRLFRLRGVADAPGLRLAARTAHGSSGSSASCRLGCGCGPRSGATIRSVDRPGGGGTRRSFAGDAACAGSSTLGPGHGTRLSGAGTGFGYGALPAGCVAARAGRRAACVRGVAFGRDRTGSFPATGSSDGLLRLRRGDGTDKSENE
jgi:hypothetical protein